MFHIQDTHSLSIIGFQNETQFSGEYLPYIVLTVTTLTRMKNDLVLHVIWQTSLCQLNDHQLASDQL